LDIISNIIALILLSSLSFTGTLNTDSKIIDNTEAAALHHQFKMPAATNPAK
jgi:hypothetical protein